MNKYAWRHLKIFPPNAHRMLKSTFCEFKLTEENEQENIYRRSIVTDSKKGKEV